jgi:hypothetical protein
MTEMRPDVDSDQAGAESEYGNDTGFAAEATRSADPEVDTTPASDQEDPGTGAD